MVNKKALTLTRGMQPMRPLVSDFSVEVAAGALCSLVAEHYAFDD